MATLRVLDTDVFIDHFRGLAVATAYILALPVAERATTMVTQKLVNILAKGLFCGRNGKFHEQFSSPVEQPTVHISGAQGSARICFEIAPYRYLSRSACTSSNTWAIVG